MHLLYLDESGHSSDPNQRYFVLAGISIFERQIYWIDKALDLIAARFNPADPRSVELHGSPMYGGKGPWRKVPKADRIQAIIDALNVLSKSAPANRLFGCVVNKATISPNNPVEYAFEQMVNRFDRYLRRLFLAGNAQRGLIVFDKSTYESTIQGLAIDFRLNGHSWGVLRNIP